MKNLLGEAARAGIRFEVLGEELRVHAPRGALSAELQQAIRNNKAQLLERMRAQEHAPAPQPQLQHDAGARHLPFPLTDLQHAYWIGRANTVEMGGTSTHYYTEFDCEEIDLSGLNQALCSLIERHDMLRATVDAGGEQRILPKVPPYVIAIDDQSQAAPAEIAQAIEATRAVLSHQILQPDCWPLFDIRATLLPGGRLRLHVSLDMLMFDAGSLGIFFREWRLLYQQPLLALPVIDISFRDYVLAERALQDGAAHRRARQYWFDRIDTLPAAPALPLRSDPAARKSVRFSRREACIGRTRWDALKRSAAERGITPSNLLLALYADVLARWSESPHFTLNVTVSSRLPLHPHVERLLGDFTVPVLLEVDRRDACQSFETFAHALQRRFMADIDHVAVSGVSVLREWSRRHGTALQAAMPVVFTSALTWTGGENANVYEPFGKQAYGIGQTSQVWLDQHVMERRGELVCIWDAVDAVFEDGVLDAMFETYRSAIERLADQPALWDGPELALLPAPMQQRRVQANQSAHDLPSECMHAGFVTHALADPQASAIICAERTMSYGDLLAESVAVADWLIARGVRPGQPVAVLMHKGWEQIVAVYGVLLAGAAYLPIDADMPRMRQLDLLRIGEVKHILAQANAAGTDLLHGGREIHELHPGVRAEYGPAHQRSLLAALEQLAYIIFTSGTTGVPKGVMIDHRGAVNTIKHINRLFKVGPRDRVLAVSSLSFDLSVYDIFGVLAVGGALVIPDYRKGHDPIHWRQLIEQHQVTLWNSAPQLMSMLMDGFYAAGRHSASLRTVLLSGDFIPLDLPDRIRHHYADAEVISLGGATEASIWSNYHPIRNVDPAWTSIPYGGPLPNQTIWVLDSALRPCPDHVTGHIFIGGIGLAKGYWRDLEKTAARFIFHPQTKERLYDTGDLGRYAADGNVLILGRDDGQLKIRGHRVELGEIEAVLNQHPQIKQAVVLPTVGQSEQRQLVAYVESADGELSAPAVKAYLAERLLSYMVPLYIVLLDAMPVSANGKIDYRALPAISDEDGDGGRGLIAPRNQTEQTILDVWSRQIPDCAIGVTDNFFELGGDSIMATHLVRELNVALPLFTLEMHELFENLTIESLAALYLARVAPEQAHPQQGEAEHIEPAPAERMLADIDAAVAGFASLDFMQSANEPEPSFPEPRAIFLTGATGWVGAHVLTELLSLTQARVFCLVRPHGQADSRLRLMDTLHRYGVVIDPSWEARVEVINGDLAEPQLGLSAPDWERLAKTVDSIYHLGASLNVLADYSAHRKVNVNSAVPLVRLALQHHLKPVFFSSPMAVCRRRVGTGVVILHEERAHADPEGLPTGYAQSKWAAEQIFLAAAERGLPLKIYRSSHALPSAQSGLSKANDTYATVLQAACAAGVVPAWSDSACHGVPVDILARLLVESSLLGRSRLFVHIENRNPLSFQALLTVLLEDESRGDDAAACVPVDEWRTRCLEAATRLPGENASLAKLLFSNQASGAAVNHMFGAHPIDTGYFDSLGLSASLSDLTPASYWRKVQRHAAWPVSVTR